MWKYRFGQAFATYLTILDPAVDLGCGVFGVDSPQKADDL